MNKTYKTILISVALLGIGFILMPLSSAHATTAVTVQFEKNPLFNEQDVKPGDSVTRWIKVTNNSGYSVEIKIGATSFTNPIPSDDLSHALTIEIKEGMNTLYGPKPLSDFYQAGEVYLSNVANGNTVEYDVTISFPIEKENEWQSKKTGFDIIIRYSGEEGTIEGTFLGTMGGGGGGIITSDLYIFNEQIADVSADNITITWQTNLLSNSRVIYSALGQNHTFYPSNPPYYGYADSNIENPTEVTFHSMIITGLQPATTYYFRCVSKTPSEHAISTELSFTTKGVAGAETEKEEGGEGGEGIPPVGEEVEPAIEGTTTVEEGPIVMPAPEVITGFFPNLLANIGDIFKGFGTTCYPNFPWWIILIFGAYPLLTSILNQNREKKIKTKWLWVSSIIIILILFLIWLILKCLYIWLIAIAILIYLFVIDFLKKRK